jgi:hypothetical protein
MKHYFVSWDSDDENMVRPIVTSLRKRNPTAEFFWSKDSIPTGRTWDDFVYTKLSAAEAVIAVLTSGDSGLNNFINFEVGGAIGGAKKLLTILAPGLTAADELSTPLKCLQYTNWADKHNLARSMTELELEASVGAVQDIVDALTPYEIIAARYGHGETWHNFAGPHLTRLASEIENRKQGVTVTNELMGGADPCYGTRKQLEITVRRLALTKTLSFDEGMMIKRSDLWLS